MFKRGPGPIYLLCIGKHATNPLSFAVPNQHPCLAHGTIAKVGPQSHAGRHSRRGPRPRSPPTASIGYGSSASGRPAPSAAAYLTQQPGMAPRISESAPRLQRGGYRRFMLRHHLLFRPRQLGGNSPRPPCAGESKSAAHAPARFRSQPRGTGHPWAQHHPDYFINGTELDLDRGPQNYTWVKDGPRRLLFAHGRDPYFPGWPDTLQLNYANPAFRRP